MSIMSSQLGGCDLLCSSVLRPTKVSMLHIADPLWEIPLVTSGIPSQRPGIAESVSLP